MKGIDLNTHITYHSASFRFFGEHEHHVTRFFRFDVLLLVFDGTLRFSEDGAETEVHAGQYYIQQKDRMQDGKIESDAPKYLYVHFLGDWTAETDCLLPSRGEFDRDTLYPLMEKLNQAYHGNASYTEQCACFFEILTALHRQKTERTPANRIADYMEQHYSRRLSLAEIGRQFHFSKNHVINIFKKHYGMTPAAYLTLIRIRSAERLLIITSRTAEDIALDCGFSDYSHFYRAFKKQNGLSPTQWRQLKQSE